MRSGSAISRALCLVLPLCAQLSIGGDEAYAAAESVSIMIETKAADINRIMRGLRAGISRQPGGPCSWYSIDVDERMQVHYSKLNLNEIVFSGELLESAAEICLQAAGYKEQRIVFEGLQDIGVSLEPLEV